MDTADRPVPDLVPARMLNEFTYCPRLFYLEWVDREFRDNDDTVAGRWEHRAVDRPTGHVPGPDEHEPTVARSVSISSDRLGLVAVIDLLEAEGNEVVPVDVKRSPTPPTLERSWEPDRVQLCAQGLLLQDAGYQSRHGILYYAGSRERVTVPFDDALIGRTLDLLRLLRLTAAQETPPPPLVDSPKCPRCSLVGICLPDELNFLTGRSDVPRRRIIPSATAARPLYLTEQGTTVTKDHGLLVVRKANETLSTVRLLDVSMLCLFGNIQVSSQLLRELLSRDIPVSWFSFGGWFTGLAHGIPHGNVELRRRQALVATRGDLDLARAIIAGKIHNARTLLRRNASPRPEGAIASLGGLLEAARSSTSIDSLRGVEGAAARLYFGHFNSLLQHDDQLPGSPFHFDGRNRRPPPDPINALLGYCYALLVKDMTATAWAIGLDPFLGFYHRPRFGRPALALDVAEEFRPLVADSVVLRLVNNREVTETDFVVRAGGVALSQQGRRATLAAYERRLETEITHPLFHYKLTYRRLFEVQLRLLAAYLLGEIPHYQAFITR